MSARPPHPAPETLTPARYVPTVLKRMDPFMKQCNRDGGVVTFMMVAYLNSSNEVMTTW